MNRMSSAASMNKAALITQFYSSFLLQIIENFPII